MTNNKSWGCMKNVLYCTVKNAVSSILLGCIECLFCTKFLYLQFYSLSTYKPQCTYNTYISCIKLNCTYVALLYDYM